jgi:A/G-specific adenine glycosylase
MRFNRIPCSAPATALGGSTRLARVKDALLAWYRDRGRDLPWRHTRDPYAILVSEVMLQQNGVENVGLPALRAFSA